MIEGVYCRLGVEMGVILYVTLHRGPLITDSSPEVVWPVCRKYSIIESLLHLTHVPCASPDQHAGLMWLVVTNYSISSLVGSPPAMHTST